jgi:hypothetical protein
MCSDQKELDKRAKKEVLEVGEKIAEILCSYNKIPKTIVNRIEEINGKKVVTASFPVMDFFTFVWLDSIVNSDDPYLDSLEELYLSFTYCRECGAWFADRFIYSIEKERGNTIEVYCPEGHLIEKIKLLEYEYVLPLRPTKKIMEKMHRIIAKEGKVSRLISKLDYKVDEEGNLTDIFAYGKEEKGGIFIVSPPQYPLLLHLYGEGDKIHILYRKDTAKIVDKIKEEFR